MSDGVARPVARVIGRELSESELAKIGGGDGPYGDPYATATARTQSPVPMMENGQVQYVHCDDDSNQF